MAKFCANGHQMEDTWEVCPYCQRTGYQPGASGCDGENASGIGSVTRRRRAARRRLAARGCHARDHAGRSCSRQAKIAGGGWFVALTGQQKGEDFRIREGPNTIGSAPDADIVLRDPAISGKHASLRYKDQKFTITDLDSTNGTFLNDRADPSRAKN